MSPWAWYWKLADDESYGAECASRGAAIAAANEECRPGDEFEIIEARMSDARRYEGLDYIPFLRTRNHERLAALASKGA